MGRKPKSAPAAMGAMMIRGAKTAGKKVWKNKKPINKIKLMNKPNQEYLKKAKNFLMLIFFRFFLARASPTKLILLWCWQQKLHKQNILLHCTSSLFAKRF